MVKWEKQKSSVEMELQVKTPIFGFESVNTVRMQPIDEVFSTLVALNEEQIRFTLCNPYALLPEYDFEIPDEMKTLLEIEEDSSIGVYAVVVMQNPLENSMVNLLAPVIVNLEKNYLAQVSLDGMDYPNYTMRVPIHSFKN